MKYIRTKDGIYEVDVLSIHYIGETHFSCWDIKHTRAFNDWHIIKQADTIEELCDEFVCLENKMTFHDLGTITSSCNLKHLTIYGAIWTEWGLKYIAKMNDKGELELL